MILPFQLNDIFFATPHERSACDGIGGTVKRLAAKASLQRPYSEQIMTPHQLFDWAKSNIRNISFAYLQEEYAAEEKLLEGRFSEAVTIPGTRQFHSFVPVKKSVVQMKYFSYSSEYSLGTCVFPAGMFLPLEEIQEFVTCMYDSTW
ncbi:hypothetical protein AVEN_144376-1 [Araneus ventricosus]|uniref:Uncharacterized protein n=1 Tax=Araneus ventricosus TaxID=182803 RepID=A0A4Y2EA17_ARAVE|nr:hypothetical protein AVEN_144376-1 [Araneus ventricosus]